MDYVFHLSDLLEVERLQTLQDNLSKAMGIALVVVDAEGVPVTKPSGFSPFCVASRQNPLNAEKCFQCDNAGGRAAMLRDKPIVYRCYCDFVEFAVPITVHGQYLGAFISGQVRVEPEIEQNIDHILGVDDSWRSDRNLVYLHENVRFIPYEKFEAAAYSLLHVTLYLAEQGYSNIIQKELNANSVKLADELRMRAELERLLHEAEFKALSYQINPHFLFNVLNTIGRLAFLEGAESTETTVYDFADMMRYILKKSDNKLITINTELKHVKSYLAIQKVRMKDRFTYDIDVPKKYLDIASPFLILQPLIENCFNYVVEPRESVSYISIKAYDNGRDVILEIADNGDGIPLEKIGLILSGDIVCNNGSSIGINNVQNRLRLSFGNNYGLEIESPNKPNMGTVIRLRFPMTQKDDQNISSSRKAVSE